MHRDLITQRALTEEEAGERFGSGLVSLILLCLMCPSRKADPRPGPCLSFRKHRVPYQRPNLSCARAEARRPREGGR